MESQSSRSETRSEADCRVWTITGYPDSCLDFAFVTGAAGAWQASSHVIVRNGDYPDDEKTSDHRPVELVVEL